MEPKRRLPGPVGGFAIAATTSRSGLNARACIADRQDVERKEQIPGVDNVLFRGQIDTQRHAFKLAVAWRWCWCWLLVVDAEAITIVTARGRQRFHRLNVPRRRVIVLVVTAASDQRVHKQQSRRQVGYERAHANSWPYQFVGSSTPQGCVKPRQLPRQAACHNSARTIAFAANSDQHQIPSLFPSGTSKVRCCELDQSQEFYFEQEETEEAEIHALRFLCFLLFKTVGLDQCAVLTLKVSRLSIRVVPPAVPPTTLQSRPIVSMRSLMPRGNPDFSPRKFAAPLALADNRARPLDSRR